ncbi:uncharacterized protein LOC134824742 [Bolinopsis microptera]|uniref:uncharacterized protein LOC134824742 n=1 Tax=Bolinopsis microptera TaxID=2820187 RepID=UPI003079F8E3
MAVGFSETVFYGDERVLTARLHGKHLNISVVVAYAPTDGADDGEKDRFYNVLSDTFGELPRHDLKLLLGDFNGKVTSNLDMDSRELLVENLSIVHQATMGPGSWISVQPINLLLVELCSSIETSTRSLAKITAKRHDVPAIEHLRNSSKVQEYNVALQNRFDCLANEVNLEDMWDNFKQTVTDVSMEVLGKRPRKVKEQHLSQTSKNLIEQRGMFKRRDPTSNVNRSAYSKLNKLVKKSCKIDDNNWATKIATDLEEASKKGQQREVWDKIKKISGKKKKKVGMSVRDKDGHFITDPDSQKERWKEHFTELLNPPLSDGNLDDLDGVPSQPSFDYLSCSDGPPSRDEISYALKKLKNCKSAGVDEITNEQLKYGGSALVGQLELLFKKVWEEEVIPEDWLKGVIVVIGKKGDTSYCCNNRGITLRATSSKVLQMVLLKRLDVGMECLLRENQCGFRRNRSCIDQIYSIRTIIHNCIEFNIPLYAFFNGTMSAVRVNGEMSDWFSVNSGTGQGDIQGPPVFNFCLNFGIFLAEVHKAISHGAVLQKELKGADEKVIMDSDYADDLAVMDNTEVRPSDLTPKETV